MGIQVWLICRGTSWHFVLNGFKDLKCSSLVVCRDHWLPSQSGEKQLSFDKSFWLCCYPTQRNIYGFAMIRKNSKYTIAINMPVYQYEIHKMKIFSDGFSRHRRFDIYVREVPYTDEFPYECNIDEWYRAKCSINYLIRLKSSPPSVAYMRQWIMSALVQIMACRLFGAKPLSKPMLGYFLLEQISVRFQ